MSVETGTPIQAPVTPRSSSAVRRGRRAAGIAAVIVGGLVASWLAPGLVPTPQVPAGTATILPDHIDGYSPLNDVAEQAPPGRTLLTFVSGSWDNFYTAQQLMLGTDGATYRQLGRQSGGGFSSVFLAPDGLSVLVASQSALTASLMWVDLTSGARREIALPRPTGVVLHAWSPDGRYVAYGQADYDADLVPLGVTMQQAVLGDGVLTLLDLRTGVSTAFPKVGPVAAAAFAPDSTRLVVQSAQPTSDKARDKSQVQVVGLDGVVQQIIPTPEQPFGIVPRVAWSPDGRWIAFNRWLFTGRRSGRDALVAEPFSGAGGTEQVLLVAADGSGERRGPIETGVNTLGWRDADHLVTTTYWQGGTIWENSVVDGSSRELARFDSPTRCEYYTTACLVQNVMVATNLLPRLQIVAAPAPARGGRGARVIATLVPLGIVVVFVVVLVVLALHRRRRRLATDAGRR